MRLGFKAQPLGIVTVYSEANHDVIVVLPYDAPDNFVYPLYVTSIYDRIIRKGIADKQRFDRLLGRSMSLKPKVQRMGRLLSSVSKVPTSARRALAAPRFNAKAKAQVPDTIPKSKQKAWKKHRDTHGDGYSDT